MWSLRIRPLGASSSHGLSTHITHLPVSGTGLSPFEGSLGYQPPIFSSLESEVHAFVQRCRRTWSRARQTLLQVGARTKAKADRHGQGLPSMSSVKKCGFHLRTFLSVPVLTSLPPKFIGPFTVTRSLVRWRSASNFLQRTGGFIRLSCFQIKTCCSCFH